MQNGGCNAAPTATVYERCDGLQIDGITYKNGPRFHLHVVHSNDVSISNVKIFAPEHSHNTDGIDLTNARRVNIHDCTIGTGDDCIAIKGGTSFLNISNVICGPGHGISVGSLGEGGEEESVSDVNVWNCTIKGTFGGVKVKTWPGGKGHANAISFKHITVINASFPVMIDQHYNHSSDKGGAVRVSDVTFSDVQGTCSSDQAVILDCSDSIACSNIKLDQINIKSVNPSRPAIATCNHAEGTATNILSPSITCLSSS
ncbi:hypothetical protein PIB30_071468 [Stylosanthes scabra]|uniref:Polygalacturonase n=1 Tax=Stylosanthes scabra TaxID=79078 RepID=A0ABU6TNJ5_9FABA|nr:hypothetical protein [Stylosanthes scabra]